jgi:glutamine synthetase
VKDNLRETFEYRGPDPLANAFLLFAGITLAVNYGLENSDEALKIAEKLQTGQDRSKRKRLQALPRSCSESARKLRKDRRFYEADGVFPKKLIDKSMDKLRAYKDKDLWENATDKPDKIEKVLRQYLHYG